MMQRKLTDILKQMNEARVELGLIVEGLADSPAKRDLVTAVEDIRRGVSLAMSHDAIDTPPEPKPEAPKPVAVAPPPVAEANSKPARRR